MKQESKGIQWTGEMATDRKRKNWLGEFEGEKYGFGFFFSSIPLFSWVATKAAELFKGLDQLVIAFWGVYGFVAISQIQTHNVANYSVGLTFCLFRLFF